MSREVATIVELVRERVRRDGIDLASSRDLADRYVRDAVRHYSERALGGSHPLLEDEAAATRSVLASIAGYGVLQPLIDDPTVEEVWVNRGSRVFVARGTGNEEVDVRLTPSELHDLVERLLSSTGRRVDLSMPFVDAALPDGSRLHVASGDVARGEMSINIRKFSPSVTTLASLVDVGSVSHAAATFLQRAVIAGCSIVVSGATHAGKTTLLGALVAAGRQRDRVVTVEETFELHPPVDDIVALQCRQPSLEGTGEVTLRTLVKESLRMRPDRLIVGEVRGAEALDLLIALNAGVPGGATIHANSAREALRKLTTLPLLASGNVDRGFVVPTVAACVDLVVHCAMDARGNRAVTEIVAPTGSVIEDRIEASTIFSTVDGLLQPTGSHPARTERFTAAGIDVGALLARAEA